MRGSAAALALLFAVAPQATHPETVLGEAQAKTAALEFGRALTGSDASLIKPMLPRRGKVRLHLDRLGPEDGSFSSGQTEAVLKDFLRQGSVGGFDLLRIECASGRYSVVRARAKLTDREGAGVKVQLNLTFEPEGGRWVLREIRETPP